MIRVAPAPLSDVRTRFGERLRYLRLNNGLSQEELADRCGLDRTYIGGIERGERNPSLVNIDRIATALHIPMAVLFEEIDQVPNRGFPP